ncbi:MAG TPA: response regulator transcription factor [Myxococcota bacterium]|nr:response regulator transcription factor [Myxococcota bacterium]
MRARLIGPDPLVLGGLRSLLERVDITVADNDADGVIWDVGLGEVSPAPALDLPVLALATNLSSAREALGAGADGVLMRDGRVERIRDALAALAAGMRVVDAAFDAILGLNDNDLDPVEPLTSRENEVLQQLAQGLSNRSVAKRLGVSEHTVKFHVNALLQKLEARNRTDAVVRATRMGLLTL